jgi:hypothetical protein
VHSTACGGFDVSVGNHTGKFQLPVIGLTLPVLVLLLVLSAARTGTVHPSFLIVISFLYLPVYATYPHHSIILPVGLWVIYDTLYNNQHEPLPPYPPAALALSLHR